MAKLLRVVSQPWTTTRVGDEVLAALNAPFTAIHASVGFVNASGVRHISAGLSAMKASGGFARFVVGVDGQITSETGVVALRGLVDELWLFRHPGRPLFHPKTYLFEGSDSGLALVGSPNLTESALWVNYEDLAVIEFDLLDPDDRSLFDELKASVDVSVASANAHLATDTVIDRIKKMGLLPSEAERRRDRHSRGVAADNKAAQEDGASGKPPLFPHAAVQPPPAVPLLPEEQADAAANPPPPASPGTAPPPPVPPQSPTHTVFVLRLGHRDAGSKPGFSPDIFIPLAAYRADPAFWGTLSPVVTPSGNTYPERYVAIEFRRLLGGVEQETRRLYLYEGRAEFRLNARQIHEDSVTGDLMTIEVAPPGIGVEYVARVIKPTDPLYSKYDGIASNTVPNSDKRWGYA